MLNTYGTYNIQNNLFQISRNDPSGADYTANTLAASMMGEAAISGVAMLAAGDIVGVKYANYPSSGGGTATSSGSHFLIIRRLR